VPLVAGCWVFQIASLAAIGVWAFVDCRFDELVNFARASLLSSTPPSPASAAELALRVWILRFVAAAVVLSFFGVIAGLAFGSRSQRRIFAWLALTTIVAGWLTLAVSWRDIAWRGQQWRLARQIETFAPLAELLHKNWPTKDGELTNLGAFMAYPHDSPRMLMIIARPSNVAFARCVSVERSTEGAIRFELSDGEDGAWLEWHPACDEPASFQGGLETDYQLDKSAHLGDCWFATRYRAGLPAREL